MFSHQCDFRKGEEAARAEGERHYRRALIASLVACVAVVGSTFVFASPWAIIPISLFGVAGVVFIWREIGFYAKCNDEAVYLRGYSAGRQAR